MIKQTYAIYDVIEVDTGVRRLPSARVLYRRVVPTVIAVEFTICEMKILLLEDYDDARLHVHFQLCPEIS